MQNFGPPVFIIEEGSLRPQLFLLNELNTAPRLRTKVVVPSYVYINTKINVTTGNNASLDGNKTTSGNTVSRGNS